MQFSYYLCHTTAAQAASGRHNDAWPRPAARRRLHPPTDFQHFPLMSPRPSAKPQPTAALRERVVEAAMKAFYERGIRLVTMDEIAHSLTMSKRTLYQLFADKEELLIACAERGEQKRNEQMERIAAQTDSILDLLLFDFELKMRYLEGVSPAFFSDMARYPRAMKHLEERRQATKRTAVEFLNRGVKQGLLREEINFEIVYDMLSRSFDYLKFDPVLMQYPPVDVFLNTVFTFLRGCTTSAGAAMMDAFLERYRAQKGHL